MHNEWETVWEFNTTRFCVRLDVAHEIGFEYDGDDEGGETQAKLNSGEYVAFESRVVVNIDGHDIGHDYLGGSVYNASTMSEFWTAHRSNDPMNRNCSIMRAKRGEKVCICHYFPGMVTEAIAEARKRLCNMPRMRCGE